MKPQVSADAKFCPEQFLGAWSLVDIAITYPDGRPGPALMPITGGMILYTPDGHMSAALYTDERKPVPGTADVTAKAAAYENYMHYAGTWALRGETVVHSVTASLNPALIGTDQVRNVEFKDGFLFLSADDTVPKHGAIKYRLCWRKL